MRFPGIVSVGLFVRPNSLYFLIPPLAAAGSHYREMLLEDTKPRIRLGTVSSSAQEGEQQ